MILKRFLICLACLVWGWPLGGMAQGNDSSTRGIRLLEKEHSKLALVIGNGAYENAPLANPKNDAVDMAQALKGIGFDVIFHTNEDKRGMVTAIREFGERLARADIGLFYYAGHGMQIHGTNYLIPLETDIQRDFEVEYEAVPVGMVLGQMEAANNPLNIVVLDACRDNPFKQSFRSSAKGLARMDAPEGTLIAYATRAGSVSADGTGRNGIYTEALLNHLSTPGLEVRDMFNRVGLEVKKMSHRRQIPWVSNDPFPDYFLAGGAPEVPGKALPAPPNLSSTTAPIVGQSWVEPRTGIEMVWVPGGCFQMGCDTGDADEKPVHRVCLDGFWMGKTEVTQAQWEQVMGNNPSISQKGADYPVDSVSWDDANAFIQTLNDRTGHHFELPSEAFWEYAATGGGRSQRYAGGETPDLFGWYDKNSGGHSHPVADLAPNSLGLYDMSGNVWEWCKDVYVADAYGRHGEKNPLVVEGGTQRVFRGGGWLFDVKTLRVVDRSKHSIGNRFPFTGFRLCLPVQPQAEPGASLATLNGEKVLP
ncbi:MAG: SUMF1/EgtB/PvdO family nonheme iron enzyme [Desulfovibrionales bacterium]|nr:SUMF1/EgtB/PvdO family nonheme iron enzyme [Desulfovibrionales bacterium]